MKSNPISLCRGRLARVSLCRGRLARDGSWHGRLALAVLLCTCLTALFITDTAKAQDSAPASSSSQPTTSRGQDALETRGRDALATTAPTTAPAPDKTDIWPILPLLVPGLLLLIIWAIRRIRHPEPFGLRQIPGRPNSLTPVHVLVIFLAIFIAQVLLIAAVGAPAKANKVLLLLAIIGGQAFAIWLVLAMASRTFRFGIHNGMGLNCRHWLADSGRAIIAVLAVLPVVVGLLFLSNFLLDFMIGLHWLPKTIKHINDMLTILHDGGPGIKVLAVIAAVVMAPLSEELFFRGLCQSMLRNYVKPWPAVVITSAFFALMHIQSPQDVIPIFALSLVLTYNYERTGRLLTPILTHAMFNAAMVYAFLVS